MNILIPHQWLLEHLETEVDPETLQELVSLSGPSVERIYEREGESVYDIEITTNRVDSMSVRGVAREAAVILSQQGKQAQLKNWDLPLPTPTVKETDQLPLPNISNEPKLNQRTICVILSGVKRAATPDWMAKRLQQTEMNVHDAVIDITNYITHELGHPCHAFDYDKLMNQGGEIIITEAKAGEEFITLDGNAFETVGGEVVFKNGEGTIIDLPSIKGTANTSIDENTQNVLLLMESIRADKVRFASMTHAIRTTAAQLMEKNVDPHLAADVLAYGAKLYQDLCGAEVASEVYDDFSGKENRPEVKIDDTELRRYLGVDLPQEQVVDILERLGCSVQGKRQENSYQLRVTPPTFRPDLNIPADIVEEVARIYGYHNLPSTLMPTPIPTKYPENTDFALEEKVKRFLANAGWQEYYGYSMVSQEVANESGFTIGEHISLQNPLTEDRVYLRRSLLPSLAEMIEDNKTYRPLSVFELAAVYISPGEGVTAVPKQPFMLSLMTTQSYNKLKGMVETLLGQIYLYDWQVKRDTEPQLGFEQSAKLVVEGVLVGHLGIWSSKLVGAELDWQALLKLAKANPSYQPLPKTATITEDMTFTLPEKTEIGPVIETIYEQSELIKDVQFKGQYQQNTTLQISYFDPETNVTREVIDPIRKQLVTKLKESYDAHLVGSLA